MDQDSLTAPNNIEKTGAHTMVTGNSMAELLATRDDFRFAETEGGRRTFLTRWMHTYLDRVLFAAQEPPDLFQTFFEVTHLISPVISLFAPRIIAQALKPHAIRAPV